MRKLILFSMLFLLSAAYCQEANDSIIDQDLNETLTEEWHVSYLSKFSDNSSIIAAIIGLTLAYLIGKFAFKFIKATIIILLIILLLRIIF